MFNRTSVKLLKGSDFHNEKPWELKNKRCAFVLFYADWCGHCNSFKDTYINFANVAQFIKVYAVNSDTEENLMKKLSHSKSPVKIEGFPTIWLYKNGKPFKEYRGQRTFKSLNDEAKKLCNENCNCDSN
jgi:thiol-disulfide isomerase/thioredoxin